MPQLTFAQQLAPGEHPLIRAGAIAKDPAAAAKMLCGSGASSSPQAADDCRRASLLAYATGKGQVAPKGVRVGTSKPGAIVWATAAQVALLKGSPPKKKVNVHGLSGAWGTPQKKALVEAATTIASKPTSMTTLVVGGVALVALVGLVVATRRRRPSA